MVDAPGPGSSLTDDRTPYVIIDAVMRTVARLAPDIPDEEAAWDAYIASKGPEAQQYLRAVRGSHHSVFLYQQQDIYEFGIAATKSDPPEKFCEECGRAFMEMFFLENVFPFLRVALVSPTELQSTIAYAMRYYLNRYAGERYVLSDELDADCISLTLTSSDPGAAREYFEPHGLDPDRCFRNSFHFVAAAFDEFLAHVVEGYDPAAVDIGVEDGVGRMRFPVKERSVFTYEKLIEMLVGHVGELQERQRELAEGERLESDLIIGSAVMRETWDRIRRASRSDEIVLLRGESGTGKSFIARKIHGLSERRDRPFVEVGLTSDIGSENMIQSDLFGHEKGAFTGASEHKQGLFSLADGGTIFLDEIGDASKELQAKLLRVMESQTFKRLGGVRDIKVDVRVIAATNRDLEGMVEDGSFRRDLYYRLNVIAVHIPPLRRRADDIPALAEFLFSRATSRSQGQKKRLPPALAERLGAYPWPGNIRELDHALKAAAAMAEGMEITAADMPPAVREAVGGEEAEAAAKGAVRALATESRILTVRESASPVIDVEALRRAIRETDPAAMGGSAPLYDIPAHFEHAKRTYLAALVEEFGGDLALIARFWDRSSEKTIRKLIRDSGLEDRLREAREKGRPSPQA
ncbi:MAG: sigma 54-interacting transcriptional regulator [Planctomycetota bacterium]|jgi:DNA-binding NtrC family response regulator